MEFVLTDAEFALLRDLVYQLCGINLAEAKKQMLKARLAKRLRALGLSTYRSYYDLLISNHCPNDEMTEFINCVTTNKTDFYRESHHFEYVSQVVLPELAAKRQNQLSIWHAGCSTGEEPYTLSIVLHEELPAGSMNIRQLATDIDTNVLARAHEGAYELEKLEPIPMDLKRRYFFKGRGSKEGYAKIKPELAEWLTFAKLNLLAETWPFKSETRFDMIFCRNVMIYFDKPTQRRLVQRFEELLVPGGTLFIGHSESLLGLDSSLRCLGRTIYRNEIPERASR